MDPRIRTIADHFGFEAQVEKAIEEMAELIVAIKHLKKRDENAADHLANFVEELADVKIMVDQLVYLTDKSAPVDMRVEREIEFKIQRTLDRMRINEPDMHPDEVTARKFMEKDPETLKALGIFD